MYRAEVVKSELNATKSEVHTQREKKGLNPNVAKSNSSTHTHTYTV